MKAHWMYILFGCFLVSFVVICSYFIAFAEEDANPPNTTEVVQVSKIHKHYSPSSELPSTRQKCFRFANAIVSYYQNASDSNLKRCCYHSGRTKEECQGILNEYAAQFKYIIKHRPDQMTANQMCCSKHNICNAKTDPIDFTIEYDREPVFKAPKTYNFDENTLNQGAMITVLHLSDFRYDPLYAPGSNSRCMESACCRNSSTPKTTHYSDYLPDNDIAGYWGDYHNCDTPGHLVENVCSQVATNHKNIDIIYYTGDFGDHFDWLGSKLSVMKSIEFVTRQIKDKFPNVPVMMTIGNHDIHPANAFAPRTVGSTVSSQWLYHFVADLWSDWLPADALSTLRVGGYYSFVFRPGFRIIVLNNNHCFVHNTWLYYSPSEMITELEWLRDTLIEAEKNNENVHILGHLPPNSHTCIRAWNREYNQLIRKFAHIISGQFNGHTSTDSFTIFYSEYDNKSIALNVAWNGGSASSYIQVNPNYRLYTVEPKTFEVIDFDTYIFNLTAANLTPDQPPKWFKEYSFREAFGVDDLSPYSLSKLANVTWRNDKKSLYKMWTYSHKMSDVRLAKGCNDICLEHLRRSINGDLF